MSEMMAEELRLEENHARNKNWKRWGHYLRERQCGTITVPEATPGSTLPHDHARSRAYRWGEDGAPASVPAVKQVGRRSSQS